MTCAPPARSMTRTPRVGVGGRPSGRSSHAEDGASSTAECERPARTLFQLTGMQPDRVDPSRGDSPPVPPRKRFEEVLRARTERPTRKAPAPPRRPRTVTPARSPRVETRAACAPGELRGQARREMDVSARQRLDDGRTASAQATGRLEARTEELLRAALRTEETGRTEHAARVSRATADALVPRSTGTPLTAPGVTAAPGNAGAPAGASRPGVEGRVERALALVEHIERFVRSGRPSLALTLRGSVPGRLEVQRVAPGAVALRLSSARPPLAGELGELRKALEARGLSVRSLEFSVFRASAANACSPCP